MLARAPRNVRRPPHSRMAPDPYKYFRVEAREIVDGLAKDALSLEKDAACPSGWPACCGSPTR